MRLVKAFGIVIIIIIIASCKDEGVNTIGRYISEDDTAYSADIISASKKINADPENAELYYLRGNAFYFLDQFSDAEIDFSTAIKLDSFNALYNFKLGDCILNMDTSNSLRAMGHLENALLIKPNYYEAMNALSTLYIARQDYDKADDLLKKLSSNVDFSDQAWILRGIIKKEQKDTVAALAMMERALQINPSNVDATSQIANIYLVQQNPLAKSYYKKVLALDQFNYDAYYHLGLIAQNAGDYDEADKLYNQVKSLKRDYVFAWYNLAVVYLLKGDWSDAMEHAEQVLTYNPDHDNAWALQGYIYEQKGELEKAKKLYEKALGINPNNQKAAEGLASIKP